MGNVIGNTSRDSVITEDEIRMLQFSAGGVAEIEQMILSFVDACHTRKVVTVVGSTINAPKDRDGRRWGNLLDICCAHLIRYLVPRGESVGYSNLLRIRHSEIKRPAIL